jgi:hypothetical protein
MRSSSSSATATLRTVTETAFKIPAHCPAERRHRHDVFVFINGRETTDFTGQRRQTVELNDAPPFGAHIMVTRIKDLRAKIEGRTQFDPTGLTLNDDTNSSTA